MSINPRTKEKKEEINNFYSFKGFIYIFYIFIFSSSIFNLEFSVW